MKNNILWITVVYIHYAKTKCIVYEKLKIDQEMVNQYGFSSLSLDLSLSLRSSVTVTFFLVYYTYIFLKIQVKLQERCHEVHAHVGNVFYKYNLLSWYIIGKLWKIKAYNYALMRQTEVIWHGYHKIYITKRTLLMIYSVVNFIVTKMIITNTIRRVLLRYNLKCP